MIGRDFVEWGNFRNGLRRRWRGWSRRSGFCTRSHRLLRWGDFSDGEVLAHFFQALWADALDGTQIVHTLERPVRLAHFQNLVGSRRADSGNLLQLLRVRGIQINGMHWRFFGGERYGGKKSRKSEKRESIAE